MTDARWAWAEIDLYAIRHNTRSILAILDSPTTLMAVVKADGYGHGAVQVARAALQAGATRVGVATVREAVELRAADITAPIYILSEPPESAIHTLLDHGIIPTVTRPDFLNALSGEATLRGTRARYHLKVDTGMHRIGVQPEDAVAVLTEASHLPSIELEGVFTHFATADVYGDWEASAQLARFVDVIAAIRAAGINPGIVHAANSPATILMPETHFDMVRTGLALYGFYPSEECGDKVDLVPAMSVKARATLVKTLSIGEGVSYGFTWRAFQPTDVVTLPIGYADGLPRIASNKLEALVYGTRVEQVGRVCMDQTMFAVTPGEIAHGAEFTLIGEQGSDRILMDEISAASETITYETTCAFGRRLERVYLNER